MSTWRGSRAKERTRSRIVVSVDDERAVGKGARRGDPDRTSQVRRRASRRRRGALVVALGVVVASVAVALVGFYAWYQSDKKNPTYSLALLVDAAQRNDRQEVDRLVDIDQVTRSLVPQVVAKVTGSAPQNAQPQQQAGAANGPRQGNAANAQANAAQAPAAVRRFIEANAAVLIPGARDAVRDALVSSIRQGVAKRGEGYPFFVTATAARFAADEIDVQGDVARVSFKSNSQPVVVTLQRGGAGDIWRVVSVESDELATRIADNLSRGLPALGR